MPVVINGSTGISGTDGSAATPAVQGTDTNTGIYFPGADRIGFAEGGVQVGEFDASSNFLFNSGYGSVAIAYGCRAWVNFNGTSTVAIRADGGVSSITDNGTGDYTVNFDVAMPDTNFSPTVSLSLAAASLNANPGAAGWEVINPSTSSCRIGTAFGGSGRNDMEIVQVHVMR
jgi:hypothetical protein